MMLVIQLLKAKKKYNLIPKRVQVTRGGRTFTTTVWINPVQEEKKQVYQYGLFEEPQYGLPSQKGVGLPKPKEKKPVKEGRVKEYFETPVAKTEFKDYGSWKTKGKISQKQRKELNQEIASILNKPQDDLSTADKDKIRLYSGFGGIDAENEKGVLYDYYTSPPVAKMTYQMLDKISPIKKGESVLEPSCGTGVFFEVAPEGLELQGVELDKRSATATSVLHDKAKIFNSSFEEFNLHSEKQFDHVIGNAPFGERGIKTGFLDMPEEKSLDRYFLSRSIDNLKTDGTMAMIVHPGVMDNKSGREWRIEMLKKGQFMGAVRLPDKSFQHTHTGVNPDMIFFRKHAPEVQGRLAQLDEAGLKEAGFFHEGWAEGNYYDAHNDHLLGIKGVGIWQREIITGELTLPNMDTAINRFNPEPDKTTDDLKKLQAMTKEPYEVRKKEKEISKLTEQEASAAANKTLMVGMTKTVDGRVYILNVNHRWERVKGADEEIAVKLVKLNMISGIIKKIREGMHYDEPIDELQKEARRLIDEYKKEYEVDHYEDKDIKRVLNKNPAISEIYEALSVGTDSAILTKQNIFDKEIEIKDGHNPAIQALIGLEKKLKDADEKTIRDFFPNRADELIAEMYENEDVYLDENNVFHLKENYLTGNAWDKIDILQKAIAGGKDERKISKWKQGIKSLKEAIGWVPIEDAAILPYSMWIPEDIVNKWVQDGNGMNYSGEVSRDKETGKWETTGWNNEIVYFLNLQKQRSRHIDTATYNQDVEENWRNWLANNDEARKRLEELYNRKFNAELGIPTKTYSVDIDGWNSNITLKGHQWQSLHHLYRQGKGMSALGVGFGKTYSAIALIALLRQEGKVKRPFLQVPNNKVGDWVEEIGKTMPGLKLGYVDPEWEGYSNRVKRYTKYQELASGDYDVIILPESAAVEIQLRPDEDERIVNEIVSGQLLDKKAQSKRKEELAKQSAETKLAQQEAARNKTINFEDLGCDAIFVDEAHNHKNLFSSTLSRETGMNDGKRSERALSLFKKNEYMRKNHDGKNVFFLTATPLTNSPLEYYNMLMHLAPEELQQFGIHNIDQFIKEFADIVEGEKYDWSSGQLKSGKVLKGFKNLGTLRDMFFKYTDLQNDPERVGLEKPKANFQPNKIDSIGAQKSIIKNLSEQIQEYRKLDAEDKEAQYPGQNFLTFYSKMRTASLDLELYDPVKYKDWKNPKVEKLTQNAKDVYDKRGGGQVVFCDRVLSSDTSFNIHDKIKNELVTKGFSADEIVVVNGVTKSGGKQGAGVLEKQVSKAIEGFNEGKYKIIIGTTQTLGEGVNLQKNSSALHHFDIPYRPSDFIQRNGRIDRQTNIQEKVSLHTYLSAGTIDNYSVGLVQGKANWIDQLLKTKSNVFMNPDDDNFIDVDGLLLSLTEEFEGKGGEEVTKLKEEIGRRKDIAVKQKNQKQAKDMLAQLSLMRGAIKSFTGDKGSPEYQARLRKISHLESALNKNEEFKHLELLIDNPPDFMYDQKTNRAYKAGDYLMSQKGLYQIKSFDHKKNEFTYQNIDNKDEVFAWSRKSRFGWGQEDTQHLPSLKTAEDITRYKSLFNSEAFKKQDEGFKKANYGQLIKYAGKEKNKVVYFYKYQDKSGGLQLGESRDYARGERVLNPYDEKDRKEIIADIKAGELKTGYDISIGDAAKYFEGDVGSLLHEGAIKAYQKHPESKVVDQMISEKWKPLKEFASKTKLKDYTIKDIIEKHPEYEIEHAREIERMGGYESMVRKKPKVSKAIRFVIPIFDKKERFKYVLLKREC